VDYGFKYASELQIGDKVQSQSGDIYEISNTSIEKLDETIKVYNFEVEDWHIYYVTSEGILVHNMCKTSPNASDNSSDKSRDTVKAQETTAVATAETPVSEGGSASNYEVTWNKSINATQEMIEGTNIPKSFTINGQYVNGKEVWVHGNATKHMGEYVNSANGSLLVENELMISFQESVSQILPKVQSGRNMFYINGWEIGINGDTGVIYHALYK